MKRFKALVMVMIMVMALTGSVPTVEAKTTKTSITVTNKSTGQNIGGKIILLKGWKVPLRVKYGKTNVTKKAKYKASNKNITISKKGKITAKKVGTTTVTIKYKKKKKKFKVIVKPKVIQTTTEQATTEQATTEAKKSNKNATAEECAKILESHKLQDDPVPECNHEWEVNLYQSPDVWIDCDNFYDLYQDHLVLHEIYCKKCHDVAVTKPIPYREAKDYTSDDLAKVIEYYPDGHDWQVILPKHKHKKVCGWIPPSGPGDCWFSDDRCAICDKPYFD